MTAGPRISRRRALRITAAIAAVGLLPAASRAAMEPLVWRGTALGASATMTLHHPDRATARRLLEDALTEVRRLETVFSLYRADSAISQLNRAGHLSAPPLELVELLGQAERVSRLTGGAFDVTVQPLWQLYAAHLARPGADPRGPDQDALDRALALVDHRALQVDSADIAFARSGMAITLNGIAQGYITDRVADLLRRGGLDSVLIDLGEIRALGRHPDGRPWTAGIAKPDGSGEFLREIELDRRALATSAGSGTRFEATGRYNHLFDPHSGLSPQRHASVSVLGPTATFADALSTGFSNLDNAAIALLCEKLTGVTAIALDRKGDLRSFGA